MKAEFTDGGALIVYAENHTEAYALNVWSEKYMQDNENDRPVFGTDCRRYIEKVGIGTKRIDNA